MSYIRLRKVIFCCSIFLASVSSVGLANKKPQVASTQATSSTMSVEFLSALVSVNSADATTLQKIKGMGKKKAQAIVDYRIKNGPFKSLDDLLNVKSRGLNKNWLKKVGKFLTV